MELVEHPEVLACLTFVEELEWNECLRISGILSKTIGGGGAGPAKKRETTEAGVYDNVGETASAAPTTVDQSLEAVCILDRNTRSGSGCL